MEHHNGQLYEEEPLSISITDFDYSHSTTEVNMPFWDSFTKEDIISFQERFRVFLAHGANSPSTYIVSIWGEMRPERPFDPAAAFIQRLARIFAAQKARSFPGWERWRGPIRKYLAQLEAGELSTYIAPRPAEPKRVSGYRLEVELQSRDDLEKSNHQTITLKDIPFDATMKDVRERVRNKLLERPFHIQLCLIEDGIAVDELQEGVVVLNLLDKHPKIASQENNQVSQIYTLRLHLRSLVDPSFVVPLAVSRFQLRRDYWLSLFREDFAPLAKVEQIHCLEIRRGSSIGDDLLIPVEADRYAGYVVIDIAKLQDEYIQRVLKTRLEDPPDKFGQYTLILPLDSSSVFKNSMWDYPTCYHCGALFPRSCGSTMLRW
jgi:hypothetical protein